MTEIITGVHQVDGVTANSFVVVEGDGSLILIDTGMSKDGKKILDYVQTTMSKKASDVKMIVLTHSHVDHVRGAFEIKRATGAKVAIHDEDADYLSQRKKVPVPKGGMGAVFKIIGPFFTFTPLEADQRLHENDKIGSLMVIHTPGHTPGSISLYSQDKKLIFVGDTIRYQKGEIEGPPKQFTPDMEQAMKSVQKISNFDFEILLSGHGEPLKSPDASKKVRQQFISVRSS